MKLNFDSYPEWNGRSVVIYDGDCPFCSNFVKFQRLRETLGNVMLIDARSVPGIVSDFDDAGMPLDDGMALILNGQVYYGADCINRLAMLSSGNGLFNKVNAWVFSSPKVSKFCYPSMKLGRRIVLFLLGRKKLASDTTGSTR